MSIYKALLIQASYIRLMINLSAAFDKDMKISSLNFSLQNICLVTDHLVNVGCTITDDEESPT
jgi:hypothetical protein